MKERPLLLPLSWLYGAVMWMRNIVYDWGIFTVHRAAVPVISVGNLTAGGTGKTPLVEYLVRYLSGKSRKVAVISRGYKRVTKGTMIVSDGVSFSGTADTAGDEPCQIARKFPRAVVIADGNRARAARLAVERFSADAILLDDGFQHRSLGRDLDIVMVDGSRPPGEIPMLPAGLRREPLSGLRRAGLAVISRPRSPERIRHLPLQTAAAEFRPTKAVRCSTGASVPAESLRGTSCVAFCGIANPESFRETLREIGIGVASFLTYPDHHRFSPGDISAIGRELERTGGQRAVTTEKDAVRLAGEGVPFMDLLYYIEIEAVISRGIGDLHRLVDSAVGGSLS